MRFLRSFRFASRYGALFGFFGLGVAAACSGSNEPTGGQEDAASPLTDGGSATADGSAKGHDASAEDTDSSAPSADAAARDADAEATDAGADGSSEAGPAAVTVNVTLGGAPESGVLVVFEDAGGAVLSFGTTDAAGAFARVVPSGSQVTVVLATGGSFQLETVTALQPGDVLTAIDPGVVMATVDITSLPAGPPSGTTQYGVLIGNLCGGNTAAGPDASAPSNISASAGCGQGRRASVLALAEDQDGNQLAYTFQDGIALSGAGVDASGIPVSLTRAWSATPTVTLTAPNTSPQLGSLVYEEVSGGQVSTPILGAPGAGSADDLEDAGVYVNTGPIHPGYPDAVQIEGSVSQPQSSFPTMFCIQGRATRIAPPTTGGTIPVDLTNLLPAITSSSLAADGGASPVVTWTTAASLSGADAVATWMAGTSTGGALASWTIFGPVTATSFTLPQLPAGAPPFTPGSYISQYPTVYAVDVASYAGYADFKSSFGSFVPGPGLISEPVLGLAPILPAIGSARFTSFSAN